MDKNSMNDQAIREEALDPKQSFIVQAPAGSGKTGLLVQRFLVLLSRAQKNPEECLGITFTKKAAAEMRDRILSALEMAQKEPSPESSFEKKTLELARHVLARDKALEWDLLANPNRLKIQTIDALCTSLTRQLPILAQFGAPPKIIEDAKPYYAKAARALLSSLESNETWQYAVENLLKHLDNNLAVTERLLTEMLEKRDQWLPHIGRTFHQTEIRIVLESGLSAIYEESLENLIKESKRLGELFTNLIKMNSKRLRSDSTFQKNEKNDWVDLAELIFTKDFALRKSVTKQQGFPAPSEAIHKEDKIIFKENKEAILAILHELNEHPAFLTALRNFVECPPCEYSDSQWEILQSLMTLLPILVAELSVVFQSEGVADFVEIALGALRALGHYDNISDLALSLDYKIHHILIDEFQDTSISQWRLLEKLIAGWQPHEDRTLFLVGDPMQSIYRFRQAEVGLFIKARTTGIGGIPLKSLSLTTNFRSDPIIVQWTNDYFQNLFPKTEDIQSGAIAFHASLASKISCDTAQVSTEALDTNSEFQSKLECNSDENAEQSLTKATLEAQKMVTYISDIKAANPKDNIAILVRSRSHLKEILPALKNANILYQGVQLESLADRPIVQDLLILTRALCHLGDRLAWLALLRTPWCDLNLRDIWLIAQEAPTQSQTIWSVLLKINNIDTLSQIDKLSQIMPILQTALLEKGRLSLRDWIEKTWISLGGEKYLYKESCLEDVNAFLSALDEESITTFSVDIIEEKLNSQYVQNHEQKPNDNPIHIMTMHKAKGLEFDTVIVPGIGRRSQADSDRLLWWGERPKNTHPISSTEEDSYLLLAPIRKKGSDPDPIYRYLKKQESLRSDYESIRLLYVAATRARKRLYWLCHGNII